MRLKFQLSFLQFMQFFVWGTWYVVAGTYFIHSLKFTGSEVAAIYSSFAIAATITPLFLGALADKYFSVEKLLAFSHLIGGVLLWLVTTSESFGWIYPILFVYVLFYVPTIGLSSSMCFHHIDDAKKEYPPIRVWGTIGWILGGLLVGFLGVEDQVLPFKISAGLSIILGVFCLYLPHTPPMVEGKVSIWQALKDPELLKILQRSSMKVLIISVGLIAIPLSYYYTFVNPFLNDMEVVNAAGKMTLGQVMEVFVMLLLPWFFKVMRFKSIVFLGMALWGIRYGLFILGVEWNMEWLFIIAIAVHGLAFVFGILSVQIYLDTVIPIRLRSTTQGLFSVLTMGLMGLLGTYLSGKLFDQHTDSLGVHDWQNFWLFPCVFGIIVACFFWLFFRARGKIG